MVIAIEKSPRFPTIKCKFLNLDHVTPFFIALKYILEFKPVLNLSVSWGRFRGGLSAGMPSLLGRKWDHRGAVALSKKYDCRYLFCQPANWNLSDQITLIKEGRGNRTGTGTGTGTGTDEDTALSNVLHSVS